jgi:hypothetical protein
LSKVIKKFISANSVGSNQIRLENNSSLKARNAADSADVNIAKVNSSNNTELQTKTVYPQSVTGTDSTEVANVAYVNSVAYGGDTSSFVLVDGTHPMAANLNLASNKIINLATPTNSGDGVNKSYVDGLQALNLLKDGSVAMTGDLNLNGHSIKNIKQPIATTRAITASASTQLSLLATDNAVMYITGTASGYSLKLPNSTSVDIGTYFEIYNANSQSVAIYYNDGTLFFTINSNSVAKVILQVNGTQNGVWAVWSLETGQASGIQNYSTSSTTAFATTSSTDTQITSFTLTPMAGKYQIWYNSSNTSVTNNSMNYFSLYQDTTQITGSERVIQSVASNFTFQASLVAVVNFNGSQQLRVYVRVSAGTLTVNARSLTMIRLGS